MTDEQSNSLAGLPPTYTVADLCEWLGIDNERWVTERVIKEGRPHLYVQRKYRFTLEDMLAIRELLRRGGSTTRTGPAFGSQVTRTTRRPKENP